MHSGYVIIMNSLLPQPVGNVSAAVIALLADGITSTLPHPTSNDPLDHDAQLALFVINELSFGGWLGVDDGWEWNPTLHRWRQSLCDWFESTLIETVVGVHDDPQAEAKRLLQLAGPSISTFLETHGTVEQLGEAMILRSPYQSKEADPHTSAIPKIPGAAKRTLIEIQLGEYGIGHERSHAELFADALDALGLDPMPTAHIDACDGAALGTSNLVALGALQRRLRGLVLGQLALFEMDSVVPNARMLACCERLGLGARISRFFQIHVWADVEHERMAEEAFLRDYPRAEPDQRRHVLLGMRAQAYIDQRLSSRVVRAWSHGESALLRVPLDVT